MIFFFDFLWRVHVKQLKLFWVKVHGVKQLKLFWVKVHGVHVNKHQSPNLGFGLNWGFKCLVFSSCTPCIVGIYWVYPLLKVKQLGAHHPTWCLSVLIPDVAPGASRSFVGIEGELSFQVRNILVELPLRERNTFEYVEFWATSFTAHQEQLLCLTI